MKKMMTFAKCLLISSFNILLFAACQTTTAVHSDPQSYLVPLYLYDYAPKFDADSYRHLKGKGMCMSGIRNDAQNTTNFSFYSKDLKVRYELSNKPNTHIMFVQSYFWYAYEKAFRHAGIEVSHRCASENTPELWIIFQELDDDDLRLKMNILKNRESVYEKEILVRMPPAVTRDPVSLRLRAYDMIDLTVAQMLADPVFQQFLLQN
ncbi:MAG TPA: hypothetical protein P5294_08650 [Smithellaceae bacterium]|mgnify:CR=1 FL=1|nr:hypothetical protein [Smithellaceae bacterium]HRS89739.1 hypothetical protein [Smithellaceae bacterium]HRV26596.1 hypothetical protein [Smithellaceae bacterium]